MKKQYILASIFLISVALVSFTKKGYDPLAITRVISENTFLDATEVTNLNWREYMSWNENQYGKESKEYLASVPDKTVWKGEKFKPMQEFYLKLAAYDNYPVVGVSHEQAVNYCNWRSARINEVVKLQKKKNTWTYSCRLPTKAEWEKLTNRETYHFKSYKTDNHNLQKVTDDGRVHENDITSPVESFTPTLNGFYNLIGNVAEMVVEKGIAKGASWQHAEAGVKVENDYQYTQATNWIGFRCVVVRH